MISTGVKDESPSAVSTGLLELVKSFRRDLLRYAKDTFPSSHSDNAAEILVQSFRAQSQLQELVLRLLSSPAIAAFQARTDTTDIPRWLCAHLRIERRSANAMIRTAEHLDTDLLATRAALAAGAIAPGHADRLAEVVDSYPRGVVGPEAIAAVERQLLSVAKALPPSAVKADGDGALEEADPEAYDRKLAAELDREDVRARQDRRLDFRLAGPGRTRISGVFPTDEVAPLRAAVEALARADEPAEPTESAQPAESGESTGSGENAARNFSEPVRTPAQRRADALAEIGARFLSDEPAEQLGSAAKVVITVTAEELRSRHGAGILLGTGEQLSLASVDQFLCTAKVGYATLDDPPTMTNGRRFFTGKLRTLLEIRDRGCAFPGCAAIPGRCDAHHIRRYADGGPTSYENGVLLCRFHHGVIHHSDWEIRFDDRERIPVFLPPASLDPARTPLQNYRHRRSRRTR